MLRKGSIVKYAWVKKHQGVFPTIIACKFLKVSRSSYYEWINKADDSLRVKEDNELTALIKREYTLGRNVYGTGKIKRKLAEQNIIVSRRRIDKLMKAAGLMCKTIKHKFKVTTDSKHNKAIAPNLLASRFTVDKVNRYWVSDITYIPTKEGWLYLAIVIDLYSRQIIGWSMDRYMGFSG